MEENIYIKDFIRKIIKFKKEIALIVGGTLFFLINLSFILPKTYRTDFEINVYSKYFKNALISEVIPGMNSIVEMTQTIDSMIKEVMSDEFIDEIADKFGIYSSKLDDFSKAKGRMVLRSQFRMFSTGGQSYKITFAHSNPKTSYEVSKLVLDRIKKHFIDTRIETIEFAKKSIMRKLESINVTKQISDDEIASNALASRNPTVLKSELEKIEKDIESLKKQFNINHPRIIKLQERKETILNWLSEYEGLDHDAKEFTDAPLLMAGDSKVTEDIASKLYVKYNDVNIALEIEKKSLPSYIGLIEAPQIPTSPLFPKKRIFASLGLVLGMIFAFLYVFFKEFMSPGAEILAEQMALKLNSTFIGDLPKIKVKSLIKKEGITPPLPEAEKAEI